MAATFTRDMFHPKYWGTWLLMAFLRVLVLLPLSVQLFVGKCIGLLLHSVALKRRHITRVNIDLCFPELSTQERKVLVKDIFVENARGFIETAFSWWCSDRRFKRLYEIHGLDILAEASGKGRGVLLLGIHATTLDLGGRIASHHMDVDVTYRRHSNPVVEYFLRKMREVRFKHVIERKEMRRALKSLKQGRTVWYASDQDYGRKNSVFVPFFGVTAATISATSKLLNFNNSAILLSSYYRKADNSGYVFEISNPLPQLPTGDELEDAKAVNLALEAVIRKHPAQYMWTHRRFKTQPDGKYKLYEKRPG